MERVKTDPAFANQEKSDPDAALRFVGVETPKILEAVPESGDGTLLPDQYVVPSG